MCTKGFRLPLPSVFSVEKNAVIVVALSDGGTFFGRSLLSSRDFVSFLHNYGLNFASKLSVLKLLRLRSVCGPQLFSAVQPLQFELFLDPSFERHEYQVHLQDLYLVQCPDIASFEVVN